MADDIKITRADFELACKIVAALDFRESPLDTVAKVLAEHHEDQENRIAELEGEKYKAFTDGLEAAAEICGSMAETTYDDTDAFEAATGCESAIMQVVKDQRREQAQARAALNQEKNNG